MRKKFKWAVSALLSLLVVFSVFSVYAENSAWDCPACERKGNTGKYCGGCGHPAPWLDSNTAVSEDINFSNNAAAASPESDFEYKIEDGHAVIKEYIGKDEHVVIPETLGGCPVKVIGNMAFNENGRIKSVVIPNSVTEIGRQAFHYCSKLTGVTMSNSLTILRKGAFWNCTALTAIQLPLTLLYIGESAFQNCPKLTISVFENTFCQQYCMRKKLPYITLANYAHPSEDDVFKYSIEKDEHYNYYAVLTRYTGVDSYITVPEKLGGWPVKVIGEYAFSNVELPKDGSFDGGLAFNWYYDEDFIVSVTLPKTITEIQRSAFEGCGKLVSINLPQGLQAIGDYAFDGCEGLLSIEFPDSLTTIGYSAFQDCLSLTSVYLPDSITEMKGSVFGGCKNLVNVNIPKGVSSLDSTFWGCGITGIAVPDHITSMNGTFAHCSNLRSITLPQKMDYLGSFYGCSALKEIKIPSGVKIIPEEAFMDCTSLKTVILPAGLTTIESWAFENCSALTSINFPRSLTTINCSFSRCKNLVVSVCSNSYGLEYCKKNNLKYKTIPD